MLSEHTMRFGVCTKEREATAIAHGYTKPSVDKRLPPVGIVNYVTYCPLTMDIGDTPIESYAITWSAAILAKRQARSADEATVAGDDHSGVFRLPAELVDHIGRLAPVSVDQTSTNAHRSAVVSLPFVIE
jgi:hypothetical protein